MNKKTLLIAEKYLDDLSKKADSCCNAHAHPELYSTRIATYYGAVGMLEKLGYSTYVNNEHCHKINKSC